MTTVAWACYHPWSLDHTTDFGAEVFYKLKRDDYLLVYHNEPDTALLPTREHLPFTELETLILTAVKTGIGTDEQLARLITSMTKRAKRSDAGIPYKRGPRKPAQHGTVAMYSGKPSCRCDACREAARQYSKKRRAAKMWGAMAVASGTSLHGSTQH